MARFLAFYVYILLTAENVGEIPYSGRWQTFMRPVGDLIFASLPIKLPLVAVIPLIVIATQRSKPSSKTGRTPAMEKSLWINLGSMAAMFAWGMLRGGAFQNGAFQILEMVFVPVVAFAFTFGLRTPADFRLIGQAVVYAALWRSLMACIFKFTIVPTLTGETPPTMTTHADTMLFVTAVVIMTSWALEERTSRAAIRALLVNAFILLAIQLNNRRLAYVSLIASLVLLYIVLRKDKFKKKLNVAMIGMMPLIGAYLAAGWESEADFFKPAKALSSIFGKKEDASSKTRNIENYNLIITLSDHIFTGSGWGHEYHEVSFAYSIAEVFPQYKYVPHNSILGIWAFTGFIGTSGIWLMFIAGTFVSARSYRLCTKPQERIVCAVALCEVIIYTNQAYGDMGIKSWSGTILMGTAFAAANRMGALTGAMGPKARPRVAAPRA